MKGRLNGDCESKSCMPPMQSPQFKLTPKRRRRFKDKSQQQPPHAGRSSIYRGVTRHSWTGRYEAHLWDKNWWSPSQSKKGRQVYLGAYNDEEAAAHSYDLAALKYWGKDTILNFPIDTYTNELVEMQNVSKEEYLASLRRKSSGFSRGVSKYRGVARHHHNGRWEARIGRVLGNKYLYLGTYSTQEEAAEAYDRAAIEFRGINAVTNFDLSRYLGCPNPEQQLNNFECGEDASSSLTSKTAEQVQVQYKNVSNLMELPCKVPSPVECDENNFLRSPKFEQKTPSFCSSSSSSSSGRPKQEQDLSVDVNFPEDMQFFFDSSEHFLGSSVPDLSNNIDFPNHLNLFPIPAYNEYADLLDDYSLVDPCVSNSFSTFQKTPF